MQVGKRMCALLKVKAADFFKPLKFGVACCASAEKLPMHLGSV